MTALRGVRLRLGTSGYAFDDWVAAAAGDDRLKGQGQLFAPEPAAVAGPAAELPCFPFYPRGVRDRLRYYAERFDTVEINSTYYRMPTSANAESWARRTPEDFSFWVKVPGAITHDRDLAAAREFDAAMEPLRAAGKLAGILSQFPMSFRNCVGSRDHVARMAEALATDPIAVELRHASWGRADTLALLAEHGLQIVAVDEPRNSQLFPSRPTAVPTDRMRRAGARPPLVGYLRLHSRDGQKWFAGEAERYDYLYTDDELREWIPWLRSLTSDGGAGEAAGEVYVYFNNCKRGQAAENARRLDKLLG